MAEITFRYAEKKDTSVILDFIKALAAYEKMLDDVVATEELLEEWIFEKKKAEVIFACEDGKEVGFALFFHNFPPSSEDQVYILKTCLFFLNTGIKAMVKPF